MSGDASERVGRLVVAGGGVVMGGGGVSEPVDACSPMPLALSFVDGKSDEGIAVAIAALCGIRKRHFFTISPVISRSK